MLQIFGNITAPTKYQEFTDKGSGFTNFLSNLIALIMVIAGIAVMVNFIAAGYQYLTAEGNAQKLTAAGSKMLNSLIGIIIIAAGYLISAVIGQVFFKDANFLTVPIFKSIAP